jgi:hypothetical protein
MPASNDCTRNHSDKQAGESDLHLTEWRYTGINQGTRFRRDGFLDSATVSSKVSGSHSPVWLLLLAISPAALLLAWQTAWTWPFFSDDSFISLRYAQRLLEGHGLTWTPGERVEGYSNLLWVLATAALGRIGFELVTAARLLGAACTLIAFACIASIAKPRSVAGTLRASIAPLLLAASAPLATWTLGGLEGPMVLLWLALGAARLIALGDASNPLPSPRVLHAAGLPFALLCLTRPDGPLWTAIPAIVLLLANLRAGIAVALRFASNFATLPILCTFAQLAFRILYYGDTVPNTAHVKVELSMPSLLAGIDYNGAALLAMFGIWVPALLGTVLAFRSRRFAVAALSASLLAWLLYLAAVGGDHFPGYRLWHGALAPLAALASLGIEQLAKMRLGNLLVSVLACVAIPASLALTRTDRLSTFALGETWEWDGKIIGNTLRRAFAEGQPRIAVDAAGAVPFFAKLPALDLLGLCDRTIALSPPPTFVERALANSGRQLLQGHMHGNGRYVMDEAPDLLLFANPPCLPLAVFASGLDFESDPRWRDDYRCVVIETGPQPYELGGEHSLQIPLWVRIHGRAGASPHPSLLSVPAYLLGAYQQPQAFRFSYDPPPKGSSRDLDLTKAYLWFTNERVQLVAAVPALDGTLLLELRAAKPVAIQLTMETGRWHITGDQPVPIDFALVGDAVTPAFPDFIVTGNKPAKVTLTATPRSTATLPIRLRTVSLQRLDK